MSNLVHRYPIAARLVAVVLLPLLVLSYFAATAVVDAWAARRNAEQVLVLVDLTRASGDLVHALQRARAAVIPPQLSASG